MNVAWNVGCYAWIFWLQWLRDVRHCRGPIYVFIVCEEQHSVYAVGASELQWGGWAVHVRCTCLAVLGPLEQELHFNLVHSGGA